MLVRGFFRGFRVRGCLGVFSEVGDGVIEFCFELVCLEVFRES